MSLKFNWNFFDVKDLQTRLQAAITESIAQAPRPPSIAEPIRATRLDFGTKPPDLSFVSVLSVSLKRTHICFSLKYDGDASLTLETAVQGNPLREPLGDPSFPAFVKPSIVGCFDSLVIPFRLVLKNIVLNSMVDVVYTPSGVIINFREDPVKQLESESSLDVIPGVKQMIGAMLREQISGTFNEDLPETVWASTSSNKSPPDPFFGISRWSQFRRQEVRFSAISLSSTASTSAAGWEPKRSLALLLPPPLLLYPYAILSSCAHMPSARTPGSSEFETDSEAGTKSTTSSPQKRQRFSSESWRQFVEEPSLASETASLDTQSSRGWRPRRRVIDLRSLSRAQTPEPPLSPDSGAETELESQAEPTDFSSARSEPELSVPRQRRRREEIRRYSTPAQLASRLDRKDMKRRAQSVHRTRSALFLAPVYDDNDE